MSVYQVDPIRDERWNDLVQSHPKASVFHTIGWLETLRQTYGYEPIAFTTSAPGFPLTNAVVFCEISGWPNARRLVSLPFSDHSAPLVEAGDQLDRILGYLQRKRAIGKWNYIEIRGMDSGSRPCGLFQPSQTFFLHNLDLRPTLDNIFNRLHKDCVRRKIHRAVREQLSCEEGRSELLIKKFYNLMVITRRRHGLPVQPVAWFRNLIANLGEKAKIRIACRDSRPVAGILTLTHNQVLVYKYGCSDRGFSNLGGTQLLLWKAIEEAKDQQLVDLDMGRSECNNVGLLLFKDRWGSDRTPLTYLSYPERTVMPVAAQLGIAKYMWAHTPSSMLAFAGRLLYKYIG